MSLFTGVSVISGCWNVTTSTVDADTDRGYHLLVVKDYSRTVQAVPNTEDIDTDCFIVGGINWKILYYPNGADASCADFISFYLSPSEENLEEMEEAVEVKFQFSFIDQVEYQKPMHIRATKTYNLPGPLRGCYEFMRRDALERSTHLKDDCFTIRCDIMVCKDFSTQDADGTQFEIDDHFDYLLQNKVGADVTFEVSGERFSAHRCVLAVRSKVFMAQLFGPMTEGTTSRVIKIKDMDANAFAAMLRFIYTGSFPKMDKEKNMEEEEGQEEDVMWLKHLLVAADRYDLQRLKFLCENQLSENIGMSSLASTLALADQHHCHKLKEACFKFIQVQTPDCLAKAMATDGWKNFFSTHISVMSELIGKLMPNHNKDKNRR
ncbi:unnamed protein product [Alopecurus aequalis]